MAEQPVPASLAMSLDANHHPCGMGMERTKELDAYQRRRLEEMKARGEIPWRSSPAVRVPHSSLVQPQLEFPIE